MRFYGERLMKISKSLSKEATSVIRKLQFEPSLIISLNNLDACRGLIFWIASNCKVAKFNNEDVIVLNVNPETPRLITPAVLGVIHGYPRGVLLNNTPDPDSPPLKNILEHPHAKLEDLQEAIFAAKQKRLKQNLVHDKKTNPYNLLSIEDIEEACSAARSNNDTMLEVMLFLAALIHYSSFTKSGHYISATSLNSVLEIEKIASNDWCKLLLDHMKNGFIALEKSGTVWSPVSFLVSIFEICSFFRTSMLYDLLYD